MIRPGSIADARWLSWQSTQLEMQGAWVCIPDWYIHYYILYKCTLIDTEKLYGIFKRALSRIIVEYRCKTLNH